ncbi:hypothetical protein PSM7751_02260 [Pseudooceanicola marinus]|uniref:STAS domain-containing protein n=1 Tax=Pseudooceanicola marinus TaxID=396013 RepID=A0A1X6ZDH8_9RHOB|nr:hypothetical protein [Pseudooceanicola marinus]PJE28313.1 hypothetical protein CVM50_15330 [Pseudooceanicola marinus]SLN47709.1 hypothetical protein PSM7751_02260 [Pseudooceanicola marinus]
MNSYFDSIDGLCILHLEGRIDATQTGTLCDHLVHRIRDGDRRLIVVCAPGVEFARPAVRGLIVAATLIRAARGQFRLVAEAELAGWLHRVSMRHLLPLAPDLETALAAMGTAGGPPQRPATEKAAAPAPSAAANHPRRPATNARVMAR